jgi:F-type H+-transporting ATPase subunit b
MAEPTTHTEVPEGHGGFPPFDKTTFPSQLLWLSVIFVLLYVLMARVALPRIASILQDRRKHVDDDLAEAQRFKEQSDAVIAAREQALADARAHAQTIINTKLQQHAAEAKESRTRFEEQLRKRLATAEQSIAERSSAAMANVEAIAADSVVAIVERLIGKTPTKEEVAEALRRVKSS